MNKQDKKEIMSLIKYKKMLGGRRMKFSEAMKLLEEGKKVRRVEWNKYEYIYLDNEGRLLNDDGSDYKPYKITGEWEEHIEETEETEESNYGIQDRLSMILENQSEIKAGVQAILKWFAIETKEVE